LQPPLTQLILDKITPLDDTLADFLRHDDLLGKAILFLSAIDEYS